MKGNEQAVVTGHETEDAFTYNSVTVPAEELSRLISKGNI